MPAVAVTSAQGAYAYIVALKGFSVGCQPSLSFDQCRNWKNYGIFFFGNQSLFQLPPTILLRQQKWFSNWGET